MPKKLTATEAARNFSEVIARVQLRGESFLLTRHGKIVAQLGPAPVAKVVRLGDFLKVLGELPHLESGDAARFAEDLEDGRRHLGASGDPWGS